MKAGDEDDALQLALPVLVKGIDKQVNNFAYLDKDNKSATVTLKVPEQRKPETTFLTVNLAPADVKKEGPIYDLPIAICLLRATGRIQNEHLDEYAFVGELSLSGEVRSVRGILPIVLEMRRIGKKGILVPMDNAAEAAIVEGIDVYPVHTLRERRRGQCRRRDRRDTCPHAPGGCRVPERRAGD